jgi:hypothetical protein
VASILGAAIGKPDLKWTLITNKQLQSGMEAAGVGPKLVAGIVEMQASMHNGEFYKDYYLNRPTLGKVKMTDYAKEFAAAFKQ